MRKNLSVLIVAALVHCSSFALADDRFYGTWVDLSFGTTECTDIEDLESGNAIAIGENAYVPNTGGNCKQVRMFSHKGNLRITANCFLVDGQSYIAVVNEFKLLNANNIEVLQSTEGIESGRRLVRCMDCEPDDMACIFNPQ